MTAPELLTTITAAVLLQLLAGFGLSLWRKRAAAPALNEEPAPPAAPGSGAWPGWREFRVVKRHFEDAARSQCSFHLQAVDGVALTPFLPGQYLTFSLKLPASAAGSTAGERSITRCYSLSDRPDPAGWRITVKRVPPPADRPELPPGLSSNHFHDRVQEGDVLLVKAPAGHFHIDAQTSLPVVLIAGGIGITPMMSMLRWCVAEQPTRPVHLYYGVRNQADHAFKATLEELAASHPALRLHVVYSSPQPGDVPGRDFQHAGRVDVDLLRRSLPHGRHQFYVCGPPAMMQSLVPALRDWGVQAGDIHFEAFGPATVRPATPTTHEPPSDAATALEVRFSRTGRTLAWSGQDANLLDFAERHDLALDSGCRSGSCGACQTRLLSGVVTYAEPPDHDIAKGHCLLCVGKPQSALVLEA